MENFDLWILANVCACIATFFAAIFTKTQEIQKLERQKKKYLMTLEPDDELAGGRVPDTERGVRHCRHHLRVVTGPRRHSHPAPS